ncbi:MAG: S-adenosylmethionine:tRNA ribosyltransferase-isomerase [Ferruginibacter sp.]
MPSPKNISILDYSYQLPEEKIAKYPLEERDASKLLIYKNGIITEDIYKNIADHLPAESLLIFNNTKVIKARIRFQKPTGGQVEIFCLEPNEAVNEYQVVMNKTGNVKWKCMIGGAGKWKSGSLEKELNVNNTAINLQVNLVEKLSDAYIVEFSWQPAYFSFAEVIEAAGDIPLPPYIKRTTELSDADRYQTIYAKDEGSVAAPTAGLHFTENILQKLAIKNINTNFVTLHVGAGTFKPVKAVVMEQHEMHAEWIEVHEATIRNILMSLEKNIIAVGTTSLRTLESLYWMGVKAYLSPYSEKIAIGQWEVYDVLEKENVPAAIALQALLQWLKQKNTDRLFTQTQILIAPGYQFKIVKAIITNFHQPQSTLLLLVAAATGNDWKKIYDYALEKDFRFLSYGDGSLLFLNQDNLRNWIIDS